jgi:hypothetical protein
MICSGFFPPHLLADQFVEHFLGPVLGFGRPVQVDEGGGDFKPPLRQGDGCLFFRVVGECAGLKEWEPAARLGGVLSITGVSSPLERAPSRATV